MDTYDMKFCKLTRKFEEKSVTEYKNVYNDLMRGTFTAHTGMYTSLFQEYIMEIDLSLNRSLEELIASYWEAQYAGLDYKKETHSAFYALENYLCKMGAL